MGEIERWLGEYGGKPCLAELLCDRHDSDALAVTMANAELEEHGHHFGELREASERFASVLAELGVEPGDRVAVLLPKRVEHVIAVLAILRLGAVHVPLFTAFAAPTIAHRLADCEAKVIVTDAANRDKVAGGDAVVTVDANGDGVDFWAAVRAAPAATPTPWTYGGEDPFILLYTSGTTGHPGGVTVPVRALASFHAYLDFGLDLRPDDVYWNAADPGWAYGLYYGLVAPLLLGRPIMFLDAPFEPRLAWRVLERFRVTNFAAAPTAYRALRGARANGSEHRLRAATSAGEPLNPDVIEWSRAALGAPIHDHYGQTELGAVIMNPHRPELVEPLVAGSMGKAMPGFSALVLASEKDVEAPAGETGRLVIDVEASPLFWFQGYYRMPERTAERFVGGRYYLTGDTARRGADGRFTFSGRADDLILTAGYRIGPFEVENVLVEHPEVAEAAVVGKPDPHRGEVIHAYVVVRPGCEPTEELAATLQDFVRSRLARHSYPRAIHFVEQLPKTPSGKVQRHLLRAGE